MKWRTAIGRSLSLTGGATRKPRRGGGDTGRNNQMPSLPGSPARRVVSFTMVALVVLGATPVPLSATDARVEEVIRDPTVVCREVFDVDTTPEIWNRVLDNLYLMGRLWGIYGFQPTYQVARTDSGLHVIDPTGISGDVRQLERSGLSRRFYGRGRFNHWAVPSFFTADGVIVFTCTSEGSRLLGEVIIFLQGNNWPSRAVMNLFSGTLIRHIDQRFTRNMDNMKIIIRDIVDEPDKVRSGLAGPLRDDFTEAFPARELPK